MLRGVGVSPLVSLCLTAISFTSAVSLGSEEPSDNPLRSLKCSYLGAVDKRQFNAFFLHKLLCCMCPKGFKYVGICNSTHPNTTKCEPCESGTYIDFEPHLQRKCHPQREKVCFPPFEYNPGTTTEESSCACPAGMEKKDNDCVYVLMPTVTEVKTTPAIFSSTVPETTKIFTPIESGPEINTTISSTAILDEITKPASTILPDSSTQATGINEHRSKQMTELQTGSQQHGEQPGETDLKGIEGSGLNAGAIAAIGVVLMLLVCLAIFFIKKYQLCKGKCPSRATEKEEFDNCSFVQLSSSQSPLVIPKERHKRNRGSDGEQAQQLLLSGDPDVLNGAFPIQSSCHNSRMDQEHSGNDNSYTPDAENGVRGSTRTDDYEKFAKNIARKFGDRGFPTKEVLPLFRDILGNHRSDQELKVISEKYKEDPREMIYQLMSYAISCKGSDLDPNYLLKKVKNTRLNAFVEIVEGEMEEAYIKSYCNGVSNTE